MKSRKSFNQANQGSDNGGLGGAYCATVGAMWGVTLCRANVVAQGRTSLQRGECRCTGGRHAGLPLHRNVGMMTDRWGDRIGGVGGVACNAHSSPPTAHFHSPRYSPIHGTTLAVTPMVGCHIHVRNVGADLRVCPFCRDVCPQFATICTICGVTLCKRGERRCNGANVVAQGADTQVCPYTATWV